MSSNQELFARLFSASIALIRNEIGVLEEKLITETQQRIGDLSVVSLNKITESLKALEDKRVVLEEETRKEHLQIVEEHIHNHVLQEINVDIPKDVVREASLELFRKTIDDSLQSLASKLEENKTKLEEDLHHLDVVYDAKWKPLKDVKDHTLHVVSGMMEVSGKILEAEHEKIRLEARSEFQKIAGLISEEKEEQSKTYKELQKNFADSFAGITIRVAEQLKTLEKDTAIRIGTVEKDQQKIVEDFDKKFNGLMEKITKAVEDKISIKIDPIDFTSYALKSHTHKEFGQIEKRFETLESKMATKTDLKDIASDVVKKIRVPKDGENGENGKKGKDGDDAKNWLFKFDKNIRGLLLYKREDEVEWKSESLIGPKGMDGGGSSGGGSLGIDMFQNGTLLARQVQEVNFTGNVSLSRSSPIGVTIVVNDSENAPTAVYDEDGNPTVGVKTVIATTTTNASGHFEIDFSAVGLTSVMSYDVVADALSNTSLTAVERSVSVSVDTFTTTDIEGTAFIQRRLANSPGRLGYPIKQAGAGITIRVKVYGT